MCEGNASVDGFMKDRLIECSTGKVYAVLRRKLLVRNCCRTFQVAEEMEVVPFIGGYFSDRRRNCLEEVL